jgi:hypothetical protein
MAIGTPQLLLGEDDDREARIADADLYFHFAGSAHTRTHRYHIPSATELKMGNVEALPRPNNGAEGFDCNCLEAWTEFGPRLSGRDIGKAGKTAICNHVFSFAKVTRRASSARCRDEGAVAFNVACAEYCLSLPILQEK